MSGTQSGRTGSMFTPKSTGGRWVLLLLVIYLFWLTINHPSEAIDLFQAVARAFGDAFSAIFEASQGG